MTLNLELLSANLIIALSLVGVVWGSVLLDERKDRARRAREQAQRPADAARKG
ncbi:hypothetical protein ACFQS7_11520 [Dankookia sp. GCM10030260]|uniref:hypothetical protein n=1 Tax=Dankookia sp. GCM10030260 TaxID=3273390 RepID=UPI00360BECFD